MIYEIGDDAAAVRRGGELPLVLFGVIITRRTLGRCCGEPKTQEVASCEWQV